MSQKIIPLEHDKFYHIYNRGINGENLFYEKANYIYFLKQYEKYINPIADTYAWCLMPNHFHFLIRIKEESEINLQDLPIPVRVPNPDRDNLNILLKEPAKYFSDLFNSYTQSINKKINRHGGLFERPFRRIWIDDEKYFKNLLIYIHNNPVHHDFTEEIVDYPWTSYHSILSSKPTNLRRYDIIEWFDDIDNFVYSHKLKNNNQNLDRFIID